MANIPTSTNNPGDLRFIGQPGAQLSSTGFAQFQDPKQGYQALLNDIQTKINDHPQWTLADFSNTYAPASDGNNPGQYAANLANQLGVSPATPIKDLQGKIGQFAEAIAHNEGFKQGPGIPSLPSAALPSPGTSEQTPGLPGIKTPVPATMPPQQPQSAQGQLVTSGAPQDPADFAPYLPPQMTIGTQYQQTPEQAKDYLTGEAKGGLSLLQGADALGATKKMSGEPSTWTGLSPEQQAQASQPTTPAQTAGSIATLLASLALGGAEGRSIQEAGRVAKSLDTARAIASPKLTLGSVEESLSSLGSNPQLERDATAIQPLVESGELKPGTSAKITRQNVNTLKGAIRKEASDLRSQISQNDAPYVYRELESALKNTPLPGLIRHEPALAKTYEDVVNSVLNQARSEPAKLSNLVELNPWLDKAVRREFGDIYKGTRDMTPVRQAVKATRDTIKNFLQSHAPNVDVLNSLDKQHSFYNVLDRVAEKGAPAVKKELQIEQMPWLPRIQAKHPFLTGAAKTGVGIGAVLGAGGVGAEAYKMLSGQ